jgi:hypothetical protein
MNKNVMLSRGNVVAPAHWDARAKNFKASNKIAIGSEAGSPTPARDILIAVWRTNPASGRPECRWMTTRNAATDEGVSRDDLFRRAA